MKAQKSNNLKKNKGWEIFLICCLNCGAEYIKDKKEKKYICKYCGKEYKSK